MAMAVNDTDADIINFDIIDSMAMSCVNGDMYTHTTNTIWCGVDGFWLFERTEEYKSLYENDSAFREYADSHVQKNGYLQYGKYYLEYQGAFKYEYANIRKTGDPWTLFNYGCERFVGRKRVLKKVGGYVDTLACEDLPLLYQSGYITIKDYDKATLTGEEEVGRTLEEGIEIAKLLEKYGYDFLDTDTGTYDSFYYACPPMYNPQGFMIPLAAAAKKEVSIPVIAGGRMQDYDLAAKAVEAGEIDAVGLGRPSLADPEYPNKLFAGHPEQIRPCIGCNMGCFRRCVETGEPVSCAVNPQAGRETVMGLKPGNGEKKVVVVGGGVAGMEAARTAALRGYKVTLFEKSDHLGGHIVEAGAHSFKSEIAKLNAWYQNELKNLNVNIKMEHEPCIALQ